MKETKQEKLMKRVMNKMSLKTVGKGKNDMKGKFDEKFSSLAHLENRQTQ